MLISHFRIPLHLNHSCLVQINLVGIRLHFLLGGRVMARPVGQVVAVLLVQESGLTYWVIMSISLSHLLELLKIV